MLTWAEHNAEFVRRVQRAIGAEDDGKAGPRTIAAWQGHLARCTENRPAVEGITRRRWPAPDERSLIDFYGPPGQSRLVYFDLPYPMRLAWDRETIVTRARCHRRVENSLTEILEAIFDLYGSLEEVQAHRMDLFGGIYSFRLMRGSQAWSTHAWGVAIDLDPEQNGFQTPWPSEATMPLEVIEIFEAAGWTTGALAWGRDAMHAQATGRAA